MKTLVLCYCLLALPICAQTTTKKPATKKATVPAQNLKDAFAIHALHVLGLIEAEADKPSMSQDGRILYPRIPIEAMNDLHDEAQTKEELAVVEDLLFPFFQARMGNNLTISSLFSDAKIALINDNAARERAANPPGTTHYVLVPVNPLLPSDIVAKSPTVVTIHNTEAACSQGLEAMLRARNYHDVASCSKESLSVPAPKTLDVSIN